MEIQNQTPHSSKN